MTVHDSDQVNNDFEFSRRMYYTLLTKGEEALEDMMDVAKATEHPRAYEVLSAMMKNVGDINDKLMDMHKKKKDIMTVEKPKQLENNAPTIAFIGSTTDLQRAIAKHQEGQMIDITGDSDERT